MSQGAILALAIVLRHQDGSAALALFERSDVSDDLIDTQRKAALVKLPDRMRSLRVLMKYLRKHR